ncbi:ferritin-like domain-containing protein [Actinomycetospora sp. C-140]
MLHLQAVSAPPAVAGEGAETWTVTIARDFTDPYLELIRLLREASEIEHALLVQYLYAMFSVSPAYPKIKGFPLGSANHLMGVAIQEMEHLAKVNRMLADLGAAPNLVRQDFPYEPDIYPFAFTLEPLSRVTLAKYVYAEAPAWALDRTDPRNATPEAQTFLDALDGLLTGEHLNHIGSLYHDIIVRTQAVIDAGAPGLPDLTRWPDTLEKIRDEGEHGHFEFFKAVFLGTHPGFTGVANPWGLPRDDPQYPARDIGSNPSAIPGHPQELSDEGGRRKLAWLADLHYWIVLMLLDLSYRSGDPGPGSQSRQNMTSALLPLGEAIAALGVGMPFDPLSMGYAPGHDLAGTLRILRALVHEAEAATAALGDQVPADLDPDIAAATLAAIDALDPATPVRNELPAPDPIPTPAPTPTTLTPEELTQFWFEFDDAFHFNPSDEVTAAYVALGFNFDVLFASFRAALTTSTFEQSFAHAISPRKESLRTLSTAQLAIIDKHLASADDLQLAFEHFGYGDLFDDRRPVDAKVHMMDISGPTDPPIGYRRWYVMSRGMIVLGLDADRWTALVRDIALAWAIHSEAKPQQDTHNPPLPANRLAALRDRWLHADLPTIDTAMAAVSLVAPATP